MKKLLLIIAAYIVFSSHDMFLKMNTFFLQPNTIASLLLYNGAFDNSENAVARKRMRDVSLVGNGTRIHPDSSQWTEVDSAAVLNFKTGEAGTWVAGLSTHPNNIALSAKDFNEYLEHDGVLDMLEWRRKNNALEKDAVEKYSKHVKAIFQVGDKKTEDWKTVLGYPIEFVPQSNPYDLKVGEALKLRLLLDGKALPDQLVYAGFSAKGHSHDHHETGGAHRHDDTQLRTDANGLVSLNIDHEGQWFLRTIHIAQSNEAGLTHESNWATLTFEVGHGHGHSHGVPAYAYWVAGLLVLAALFYFFRRK